MKFYFAKTNAYNCVVVVNDDDRFIELMGVPDGYIDGIDLYSDNAEAELKQLYSSMKDNDDFQSFDDISQDIYDDFTNNAEYEYISEIISV